LYPHDGQPSGYPFLTLGQKRSSRREFFNALQENLANDDRINTIDWSMNSAN
jgi:hypothetical protein